MRATLAAATIITATLVPTPLSAAVFTSACEDNDGKINLCFVDNMHDLNSKIQYIIDNLQKIFPSNNDDLKRFNAEINKQNDDPPGSCVLRNDMENTYFCQIRHVYSLNNLGYIVWQINARFSPEGAAVSFAAFPRNELRFF